ncbi:MAG: hypothetical protein K2W99_08315 [Chthoniobacterales bacterium]|nr:hypothetical protein [Chthoniobacterales bacterium]
MKKHSPHFLALVNQAKKQIHEITPVLLQEKLDRGEDFRLVDVREESEWSAGHIPTAIHLSKGIIERDIELIIPDLQTPIVLYCSGGFRAALAAENLQRMGYSNLFSLQRGSQGWVDAGYEMLEAGSKIK